jgi:hypothetical protein
MTHRGEELERLLSIHRKGSSGASHLERRLASTRSGGLVQKERSNRQETICEVGVDLAYEQATRKFKKATNRVVSIVGKGATADLSQDIRPSISYATAIPSLDLALGGGIPSGIIEVYGVESVGKSTLLMELIRSAQGQKMQVGICTTEFFDWKRGKNLGINWVEVLHFRGMDERVLSVLGEFLMEDNRALFIDSMSGLRPEDDSPGNWYRMVLAWFEDIGGRLGTDSSVVITNQVRTRRSVDPKKFFAGGTDSTSYKAASYFDVRLELSREDVTEETYNLIVNVVANLYNSPCQIVSLPVIKKIGIDVWKDVVRIASSKGVLESRAGRYYRQDVCLAHGEDAMSKLLEADGLLGSEIFNQTLLAMSR